MTGYRIPFPLHPAVVIYFSLMAIIARKRAQVHCAKPCLLPIFHVLLLLSLQCLPISYLNETAIYIAKWVLE